MAQTNPDTDSQVDIVVDGDYTVTFSMTLPTQLPADDEPSPPYDPPAGHTWPSWTT